MTSTSSTKQTGTDRTTTSTYFDTRKRPMPFLELSPSSIEYMTLQLQEDVKKKKNINDKSSHNSTKNKLSKEVKDFDNIITFWTTLTKSSDLIQNGKRLENISWRLINRKLIVKNNMTVSDLSSIVDVSKGNNCKELKESLIQHRKKIQKKISNSNISTLSHQSTSSSASLTDISTPPYSPDLISQKTH